MKQEKISKVFRKVAGIIVAVVCMSSYSSVFASYIDEPIDNFYVSIDEDVHICGIEKDPVDLIIPETIDNKNVTSIYLDDECSSKTISIPKTLTKIRPYESEGYFDQHYFNKLETIAVDVENKVYGSIQGMLYKKSNNELLTCPAQYSVEKIVVPKKIEAIHGMAFSCCNNIKEIIVKKNVKKIEFGAFGGLENLETVAIAGSVKSIPGEAFYRCEKLRKVKLGKGIKRIGKGAFKECKKLKKIVVPKSVKKIAKDAFPKGCKVIRK